eukprot:16417908-Heterocapsa_arctica.AAC.1
MRDCSRTHPVVTKRPKMSICPQAQSSSPAVALLTDLDLGHLVLAPRSRCCSPRRLDTPL